MITVVNGWVDNIVSSSIVVGKLSSVGGWGVIKRGTVTTASDPGLGGKEGEALEDLVL